MLRLLVDQDFDQDIIRGLLRRVPGLDVVTAYEVGLQEASDPLILEWAEEEGRILVTHDRRTMPGHAGARLAAGLRVAGVIVVPRQLPVGRVIDDLEVIVSCTEAAEWENLVRHLPL